MQHLYELLKNRGIRIECDWPLAPHSTFRIGGAAKLALFPKTREELLLCLSTCHAHAVPFWVIGNGSNVVFPDEGLDGAVIFSTAMREIVQDGARITASVGVSLAALAAEAQRVGLAGLEFAHGIPATVGGAVFMNAGAYGGSIADVCEQSEYFDPVNGKTMVLCGKEQEFAYRESFYKAHPQCVVLSATFLLKPDDGEAIAGRMKDYMQRRRASQPLELPSAGSTFKRPEGYFAGKLIEDAGLKGLSVGGAEVSQKHAGFIVNRGGATAADVRALVELICARVQAQFGVALECEIQFL